jgi:hypothetical protein
MLDFNLVYELENKILFTSDIQNRRNDYGNKFSNKLNK